MDKIENMEQVYKKVFGEDWVREDPQALGERLRDLLDTEERYADLSSKIRSFACLIDYFTPGR